MKSKTKIKPIKQPGKKGTIGSTITWVAATLLIFFMLLLFLAVSGIISTFSGRPYYEIIGAKEEISDLASVKTLPAFLSVKEGGKTIEEHILEWASNASKFDRTRDEKDFIKEREGEGKVLAYAEKMLDRLSEKTKSKVYYFYVKYGKFGEENLFRMSREEEQGFAIVDLRKNIENLDWNSLLPANKRTIERAREEYLQSKAAHFIIPFDSQYSGIQQIEGYFYLGE